VEQAEGWAGRTHRWRHPARWPVGYLATTWLWTRGVPPSCVACLAGWPPGGLGWLRWGGQGGHTSAVCHPYLHTLGSPLPVVRGPAGNAQSWREDKVSWGRSGWWPLRWRGEWMEAVCVDLGGVIKRGSLRSRQQPLWYMPFAVGWLSPWYAYKADGCFKFFCKNNNFEFWRADLSCLSCSFICDAWPNWGTRSTWSSVTNCVNHPATKSV